MLLADTYIRVSDHYYTFGWVFSGAVGALIGATKGRRSWGLAYGLLLGPIGWLFMLFTREDASTFTYAFPFSLILTFELAVGAFYLKEQYDRNVAAEKELQADRKAELEKVTQKIARLKREKLANERYIFERLPKWDAYGKPINRVPPPELLDEDSASPAAAAAAEPVAATSALMATPIPRRAPTPAEINAAILRKYGSKP